MSCRDSTLQLRRRFIRRSVWLMMIAFALTTVVVFRRNFSSVDVWTVFLRLFPRSSNVCEAFCDLEESPDVWKSPQQQEQSLQSVSQPAKQLEMSHEHQSRQISGGGSQVNGPKQAVKAKADNLWKLTELFKVFLELSKQSLKSLWISCGSETINSRV